MHEDFLLTKICKRKSHDAQTFEGLCPLLVSPLHIFLYYPLTVPDMICIYYLPIRNLILISTPNRIRGSCKPCSVQYQNCLTFRRTTEIQF